MPCLLPLDRVHCDSVRCCGENACRLAGVADSKGGAGRRRAVASRPHSKRYGASGPSYKGLGRSAAPHDGVIPKCDSVGLGAAPNMQRKPAMSRIRTLRTPWRKRVRNRAEPSRWRKGKTVAMRFVRIVDDDALCVLLDLRMPGMQGFDVHRQLIEKQRHIPVVFMSAHGDDETVRRAMQHGAVAFLRKPFAEDVLLDSNMLAIERHGEAK
ncbi:CheY-like chemotaxis protein [Paraburkholderia sp. UCT70]